MLLKQTLERDPCPGSFSGAREDVVPDLTHRIVVAAGNADPDQDGPPPIRGEREVERRPARPPQPAGCGGAQ